LVSFLVANHRDEIDTNVFPDWPGISSVPAAA
jgi:hypothetical protein